MAARARQTGDSNKPSGPLTRYGPLYVCAVAAVALLVTLARAFQQDQLRSGGWGCEMSWMTPAYVPVLWEQPPSTKYRLYLYREQGWDLSDKPSGQPTLFVPGNAGSYQQVRSIASSAARQFYSQPGERAADMAGSRPRDFFAVDYNEEFSAFHGPTLEEQAAYLVESIKHVLRQYDHLPIQDRPKKVSILGHSMGGIVARLALTKTVRPLVDYIVTMSTPHSIPPLPFDWTMEKTYRSLLSPTETHEVNPILVSICGGVSDQQIASDACALPTSMSSDIAFSVFTSGIPGAWTGCDHQAIVWCHQVRWRVARTLLEMTRTQQGSDHMLVAREWLLGEHVYARHSGLQDFVEYTEISIPTSSMAMIIRSSVFTSTLPNPLSFMRFESCTEMACEAAEPRSVWVPDPLKAGAPFPMPGEGSQTNEVAALLEFTGLYAPGTLRYYSKAPLQVEYGVFLNYHLDQKTWVGTTAAPLTRFTFRRATSSLRVWRLQYKTAPDCHGRLPIIRHRADSDSGNHEDQWFPSEKGPTYLHSHVGASPFTSGVKALGLAVDVIADSSCPVVQLELDFDWTGSLAKIVLRYRICFIAWTVGWVFLILASQARGYRETGQWLDIATSANQVVTQKLPRYGVALTALSTIFSQFAWSSSRNILLGSDDSFVSILTIILACTTCGAASLLVSIWEPVLWSFQKITRVESRSGQSGGGSDAIKQLISAALLVILVWMVIPAQLASIILLMVQIVFTGSQPKPGCRNLALTVVILASCAVPFDAAVLLVWARNLWQGFFNPSSAASDILSMLPMLYLVERSGDALRLKDRPGSQYAFEILATTFAWSTFLLGGRYTFILPWQIAALLGCLCTLV